LEKDFYACKISGLVPEKSCAWQDHDPVERPIYLMGHIEKTSSLGEILKICEMFISKDIGGLGDKTK
jgi:hypothetical protein